MIRNTEDMSDLEKTESKTKVAESSTGDAEVTSIYIDAAAEKSYGKTPASIPRFVAENQKFASSTASSYPISR